MPYNVLAGMQQAGLTTSPLQSYLDGRQQKFENALAQQQNDRATNEMALRQKQFEAEQAQAKAAQDAATKKQQLRETYAGALRVAQSTTPMATAEQLFPDVVAQFRASGHSLSNDDEVRAFAQLIADQSGMALGEAPPPPKSSDPGELVQIIGANGQPVLVPRAQAVNQRPYIKPEKAPEPASTQLVSRPTPDGRVQDFSYDPKARTLTPVGEAYASPKNVSPKDANTARQKLIQLDLAERQLNVIKADREALRGAFTSGGFGQGRIPTAAGKKFDAAVDAIRPIFSGLTRVPGIGSQSDFEARLAQAPLPSRTDYEDVQDQKIQQLEDLIVGLKRGYSDYIVKDQESVGDGGLAVGASTVIGGVKVTRTK